MTNRRLPKEDLDSLQSILEKQIELAEEVLSITRSEKKALVDMDTDGLFSLARSKNDYLDLLATGDAEIRQKLVEILGEAGNDREAPVRLLDLLPHLGSEEAAAVKKRRDRLNELRKTILQENIVNKQFTANVLGYLEDAVSLIVDGIQEKIVYHRQKRGKAETSRPALLSREI